MVTTTAVARVLGGFGPVARRAAVSDLGLARAVRDGLPFAALERLIADNVVDEREVEAHFIPRRTYYARRQKATLSREQGDLVYASHEPRPLPTRCSGTVRKPVFGYEKRMARLGARRLSLCSTPRREDVSWRRCSEGSRTGSSSRCGSGGSRSAGSRSWMGRAPGVTEAGGTVPGFRWSMPPPT